MQVFPSLACPGPHCSQVQQHSASPEMGFSKYPNAQGRLQVELGGWPTVFHHMSSTLKLSLPCDQLPTSLCLNNIVSESLTGCWLTISYPLSLVSWFSSNATTSCDTPGNCTALRYSRNSSPFIFPDEVFHHTQTQTTSTMLVHYQGKQDC